MSAAPPLSVVIPTLNEAANIGRLIAALRAQDTPCEIVVADGGSEDGTERIARDAGARTIAAPRGRGQQLRAGAEAARGAVLLFLHADSVLRPGALSAMLAALAARPEAPGGNFRILFDGDEPFDRWLERAYAWWRGHGWYYGDSGIFVRRAVHDAIGGVRPIGLMEDYDLVRRLEAAGPTICIAEPPLVTSSRRFRRRNKLAVVCGWLYIHALYHLGVAPERLARRYYRTAFRSQS
jgi:rSAM/selenodomain-associated transferase 2